MNVLAITNLFFRDHGLAEQLFKDMADPPPQAYCSLVRGRVKVSQKYQRKTLALCKVYVAHNIYTFNNNFINVCIVTLNLSVWPGRPCLLPIQGNACKSYSK